MRAIRNLHLARRCDPLLSPRGSNAAARAGLAYERKIAKAIGRYTTALLHNPWFYFEDDNGPGYCCPDIIVTLKSPAEIIIAEVKLKFKLEADAKLRSLYIPVVSRALGYSSAIGVVIAKHLSSDAPTPALNLTRAVRRDPSNLIQWLGRGAFPI